jgi:hypothetical protein
VTLVQLLAYTLWVQLLAVCGGYGGRFLREPRGAGLGKSASGSSAFPSAEALGYLGRPFRDSPLAQLVYPALKRRAISGCPHGVCVATVLSPRWGSAAYRFLPTACAVGCILAPLRGSGGKVIPHFQRQLVATQAPTGLDLILDALPSAEGDQSNPGARHLVDHGISWT